MSDHKCQESKVCTCSATAIDPDDYCPIHGGCLKTYPPKCGICGKFIKNETNTKEPARS